MISVCIAAYNGAKFIEKQLESIRTQNRAVDEVIICDDGSTDGTVELCNEYISKHNLNGWKVFKNKENVGYCLNFYGAIEKANGDIIFLCDQDDEWYKNKTEVMCRVLEQNDDIKVLSSRYDIIDKDSKVIENTGIPYLGTVFDGSVEEVSLDSLIGCSYIRGFSTCFKAEIKPFLKSIDVKSLLAHDWFINSIGALLGKSAVLNTKLCGYRYHGDNVSLSDMTRRSFLGDRDKRVNGLLESVKAHSYLISGVFCVNASDKKKIEKMICLEKKRIKFLKGKNIFVWLSLIFYMDCLKRYYKSFKGGLRVWLGDFCYGYNINFKK